MNLDNLRLNSRCRCFDLSWLLRALLGFRVRPVLLDHFIVDTHQQKWSSPLAHKQGRLIFTLALNIADVAIEAKAAAKYALEGICDVFTSIIAVKPSSCAPETLFSASIIPLFNSESCDSSA